MSKKQEERANYYFYIDGQAVLVSKQVYRVYQHYEWKEEYFSYDLKTEKFQKDTATFMPSREDSYERLLEQDRQFATPGKSVEQLALEPLEAERIRFCLAQLTDEEWKLISLLFYQEKTEQEVGNMLHISHQAVNKRKQALLLKLRKIFEELFWNRLLNCFPNGEISEGVYLPRAAWQLNRRHFQYITHVRANQARCEDGQPHEVMNRTVQSDQRQPEPRKQHFGCDDCMEA